jgi:hypothetical protein
MLNLRFKRDILFVNDVQEGIEEEDAEYYDD